MPLGRGTLRLFLYDRLYWPVLFCVSSCPLPVASAIPSQRIVASGSGLGEPDQDGDEWEPADCGLLLGYYGLCPRPQTQAPGQGAPLLITCLCPILEGLVDIHRVSQGLGKGKKQGPRTSWKRTRHFPWEPGSFSSGEIGRAHV